jgi:hypothetical protein
MVSRNCPTSLVGEISFSLDRPDVGPTPDSVRQVGVISGTLRVYHKKSTDLAIAIDAAQGAMMYACTVSLLDMIVQSGNDLL